MKCNSYLTSATHHHHHGQRHSFAFILPLHNKIHQKPNNNAQCYYKNNNLSFLHPFSRHESEVLLAAAVGGNNQEQERQVSSSTNEISREDEASSSRNQQQEKQQQKLEGQMKQRFQKSVSREDRISELELKLKRSQSTLSSSSSSLSSLPSNNKINMGKDNKEIIIMTQAEHSELKGLRQVRDKFEEQYDPNTFTKEHLEFKAMHNDAFIQLSRYCETRRNKNIITNQEKGINVFFLDGPDGGTAKALLQRGNFHANQCYVANRHKSSCESLRISGGGLLPENNVVHASASEALAMNAAADPPQSQLVQEGKSAGDSGSGGDGDSVPTTKSSTTEHSNTNGVVEPLFGQDEGAFAHINFAAYYFDGCGGFAPHIIEMVSAALEGRPQHNVYSDHDNDSSPLISKSNDNEPIVIGYSLLGGNKDVVEKELAISQALTSMARRRGMRMIHVLDDPIRYGISPIIQKIGGSGGGGTFTTWLLLEPL